MEKLTEPNDPNNPIVFLDIKIGREDVGRMIIELRKDVVPKTVENFRCLCTGEKGVGTFGKSLHYKGTKFHKVKRIFMAQGGDVVKNDGTSGESIYGPVFDDENFELQHEAGVLSMANFGRSNTNNSQFFITSIECSHLDGTNVVFGKILRGFGIIAEMEKLASDDAEPLVEMIVSNCGELQPGIDWNFCDNDETEDKLAPFPADWDQQWNDFTITEALDILQNIKNAGNWYYEKNDYVQACRKYKKAIRYYNFLMDKLTKGVNPNDTESRATLNPLQQFHLVTCLNSAAVELKLQNFANAKYACNEVLKFDSQNAKALYRRGQAELELKNYDEALQDLKIAHSLLPKNEAILREYDRVKKIWSDYQQVQKDAYKDLFQRI